MGTGWMRRDEDLTSREWYAFQFFHQWLGCYTIFVVIYGFHWSGEFTPQRSRARLFSKRIYLAWPALLYLVPDFPLNVQTIRHLPLLNRILWPPFFTAFRFFQ
jgi:hypothetical protein